MDQLSHRNQSLQSGDGRCLINMSFIYYLPTYRNICDACKPAGFQCLCDQLMDWRRSACSRATPTVHRLSIHLNTNCEQSPVTCTVFKFSTSSLNCLSSLLTEQIASHNFNFLPTIKSANISKTSRTYLKLSSIFARSNKRSKNYTY